MDNKNYELVAGIQHTILSGGSQHFVYHKKISEIWTTFNDFEEVAPTEVQNVAFSVVFLYRQK
jgi:hypothetical protein